jgi:spermidine synthase
MTIDTSIESSPNVPDASAHKSYVRLLIYGCFFVSGAVSLVYQVAWVRMLSLFFGSDVYSAATTLSVFMGGLALGSWLASRLADRSTHPLILYGLCEILTSLFALAVPIVLEALHGAYKLVYVQSFETQPWLYHGFRVSVAAATLLAPTTLMGATLPLLVRALAHRLSELGRQAGELYAMNTLGALFGTIGAGFFMLPFFGVSLTVEITVCVGLIIGVVATYLGWHWSQDLSEAAGGIVAEEAAITLSRSRSHRAILLVMASSGMAALALEVVWTRILVQSFSATVYAFSIMLGCFLFGLYYGSAKASAIVDRVNNPFRILAYLQIGLGCAVTILAVLIYFVPRVFGNLVWILTGISGGAFGVASVVSQFVVAIVLIQGPTILLGAMFPFAVRAFTTSIARRALGTGKVYAFNTAGAIIGALLGGFVLLPMLGTRGGLLAIASIFAANGLFLVYVAASSTGRHILLHPLPVATLALGALAAAMASLLPQQTIVNYNLQRSTQPAVVYHGDGVSNTVDIVRNPRGDTIMMINGNVEADTSLIQRRHFILKAYLPLLLHPHPENVAVVGLGLGITLSATARYPSVKNIRVIELSPDMVAAHQHIAQLTDDILHNGKVHLRIDDGRNFMTMSDEKFDMITADPIHPRITGVGYLYTTEYYEAIKARLLPNGVVTQWMPMYNISPASFDVAFRTFARVFPYSTFWYVRGHGLFVATAVPTRISCDNLVANFNVPAVKADFASININSPVDFLGYLLMDRDRIAAYLARNQESRINTDDNADLEYRTPFEFTGRTDSIMPELMKYAGWEDEVFGADCGSELHVAARRAFEARVSRIIPELKEPID